MIQPHESRSHALGRERLRKEMRSGYRRSMRLTALGTLIPGAGLTRTRHRVVGWLLLLLVLGTVAVAAYMALTRGLMRTALALISSPTTLQYAAVALLVAGAIWAGSIILTAVSSRPARLDRSRTRVLAVFTTLMVAFVAGGSYKAAEYALITKDTLVDVFGESSLKPGEGAKVDTTAADPWKDTPRVNILLLGSDAGVDRTGTRTDSMVVASVDTKTGHSVLISLPRNLENVPLPEGSNLRQWYPSGVYGQPECFRLRNDPRDRCMLNAIWVEGDEFRAEHPDSYPGEESAGRYETREVIEEVTGLKIDHMVVIDLKGFRDLIDAMGGIDVNVRGSGADGTTPLPYGKNLGNGRYSYYFKPGKQHLNGYEALWYARTRAADDDFHRQARQRCVVKAVIGQVNPAEMLAQYGKVAKILRENIYTDIPGENLPAFVELVERVQKAKIGSVALTPKTGIDSFDPDYDLIRTLVDKAINPPVVTAKPKPTTTSSPGTAPAPTKTKTPTGTTTTTPKPDPDEC
jgi:LCP family protein required for cell wall assembly